MILLIPLYYTVGDRRGSALQTFLLRSLGQLFAMYLTLGLMFVPKMIYTIRSVRQEERDADEYGAAAAGTTGEGGPTETDPTTAGTLLTTRRREANYTEMSEAASEAGEEDEGVGLLSTTRDEAGQGSTGGITAGTEHGSASTWTARTSTLARDSIQSE